MVRREDVEGSEREESKRIGNNKDQRPRRRPITQENSKREGGQTCRTSQKGGRFKENEPFDEKKQELEGKFTEQY